MILPDAADLVRLVGRELKEHLEGTPLQTSTQARVDGQGVGTEKQAGSMLGTDCKLEGTLVFPT